MVVKEHLKNEEFFYLGQSFHYVALGGRNLNSDPIAGFIFVKAGSKGN